MSASDTITLTRTQPMPGADAAPEIIVPRRLGSVLLTRELGRGGMGVVWLGRDEMLDRDVAVKFMLSAISSPDDPRFTTFLEGAKAAAAVRHPNLTSMLHAGLLEDHGGIPYLVMEYVDGPSASQLISKRGPIPLAAALAITEGACLATAELHSKDIVHRDLKPGNVMLSSLGSVFVTDFGLALPRRTGAERLSVAGSPAYMAPEMFDGEVSLKTDVYALGITLHELLTGDVPFGGSFDELEKLHRHAPVPTEKLAASHIPEALIEVIDRATHKNALFRYRSAEHLRGAIHLALPRPDLWSRAAIELAALVGDNPIAALPVEAPREESKGTYYDTIGSRAAKRRQEFESTREEIESERRRAEEKRKDEERRVSEAIERRRAESGSRGPAPITTSNPSDPATPTPSTPSQTPQPTAAQPTNTPTPSAPPRCENCGYLLAGIINEPREPLCPECGTRFDPAHPWTPAPWPTPPRLGLILCGPMLIAAAVFLILAAVPAIRNIGVWPLLLAWAITFIILAIAVPISTVRRIAEKRLPRTTRSATARHALILSIVANVLIANVTAMCFWLLI